MTIANSPPQIFSPSSSLLHEPRSSSFPSWTFTTTFNEFSLLAESLPRYTHPLSRPLFKATPYLKSFRTPRQPEVLVSGPWQPPCSDPSLSSSCTSHHWRSLHFPTHPVLFLTFIMLFPLLAMLFLTYPTSLANSYPFQPAQGSLPARSLPWTPTHTQVGMGGPPLAPVMSTTLFSHCSSTFRKICRVLFGAGNLAKKNLTCIISHNKPMRRVLFSFHFNFRKLKWLSQGQQLDSGEPRTRTQSHLTPGPQFLMVMPCCITWGVTVYICLMCHNLGQVTLSC